MKAQTIEESLHALITVGISAAAIFVKNPASQQHAGQLINLTQNVLLPLADAFLNGPAPEVKPQPIPAAPTN